MPLQERIAIVGPVLQAVAILVAASSVLFAIYSYRRNRDKDTFAAFRLTLLELRDTVTILDRYLSGEYFAELGYRVGERIWALLPPDAEKDQVIAYLTDSRKHDLLARAIYLGRFESAALARINESSQEAGQRSLPLQGAVSPPL
jgi:hypothetical protein